MSEEERSRYDPEVLKGIVEVLIELSHELRILWPVHPRSRKMLEQIELLFRVEKSGGMQIQLRRGDWQACEERLP